MNLYGLNWAAGVLTSLEGLEFARKGYGGWVFGEVGEAGWYH